MGCQDLLDSVPGRGHVAGLSSTSGNFSEEKSLKVRAAGRSTNGKTNKADELSCKFTPTFL